MLQTRIATVNAIGYEGVTIERFLSCLKNNEIELIIDVRSNPISRKPGFSKTALQTCLSEIGIGYAHFRELGIPSSIRRQYDNIDELLDYYDEFILPQPACQEAARVVADLCFEYNAALLCFEADPTQCHRSRLARYLKFEFGLTRHFIYYKK